MIALGTEGGHASFSPQDARGGAILQYAWHYYNHVSFERLLSGPGIELVFRALIDRAGLPSRTLDAPEIIRLALEGGDPLCKETIDVFCAILGTAAANLSVGQGAFGGIYIGGGIVPRLGLYFDQSPFRARFESKGRFSEYLKRIPTFVITATNAKLMGAAVILSSQLREVDGDSGSAILAQIRRAVASLSPAEQRVAQHVLAQPRSVLNDPIATIARAADVRPPTVVRFCRSLGCAGLSDFKLRLASGLTGTMPITHTKVTNKDSMLELGAKVLGHTASAILQARDHLNRGSIERSMRMISDARRLEGSKSTLWGISASAHTDPRLQALSAKLLRADDVVLISSGSGRMAELLAVAETAQTRGAKVIAMTESQSPLARKADIALIVDQVEDNATPKSRALQPDTLPVYSLVARVSTIHHGKNMNEIRLNPLDAAWIVTETRATPNHVGGLLQFKLPQDAPKNFMRKMMAEFRSHRTFVSPWNLSLKPSFRLNPIRAWVEDENIDLEYHVRHAALPWPGGERELGELVGRLQSSPLDLSRPPWECTMIEGLEGDRFALFVKMHHSLIDGVSGVKLLQNGMSDDRAHSLHLPPFWASGKAPHDTARATHEALLPTVTHAIAGALHELRVQAASVPQLASAFGNMVQEAMSPGGEMAIPFVAPRSILNGRVREKRRFATQQFSLERLKALATAADCTINDIVLAMCGGALRTFLDERNSLPETSLTAGIPVSVRPKEDDGNGNAITFIVSTLGTHIVDARQRLLAIRQSVIQAKEQVQSLPRQAMMQYTILLMLPTVLTLLTGMGGRTRPMFNITISNVPGPSKPLYFRGAEMVATYPASIVTHGQALNITCQSYAGFMNFGFTGCHASLPSMQHLAVFTADALVDLEDAFLPKLLVNAKPEPKTAKSAKTTKTAVTKVAAAKAPPKVQKPP